MYAPVHTRSDLEAGQRKLAGSSVMIPAPDPQAKLNGIAANTNLVCLPGNWLRNAEPIKLFLGLVIWNETTHAKKTWSTNSLLCS